MTLPCGLRTGLPIRCSNRTRWDTAHAPGIRPMMRSRTQCSQARAGVRSAWRFTFTSTPILVTLLPGDFERLVLFRAPTLPPACEPPGPAWVHPFGRCAPSNQESSNSRRPVRQTDYHTVHFSPSARPGDQSPARPSCPSSISASSHELQRDGHQRHYAGDYADHQHRGVGDPVIDVLA